MGAFGIVAGVAVASLGILVATTLKAEGPCVDDPPFSFDLGADDSMNLNPCDFFSETYEEARSKFRAAAETAGADLHALGVVSNYTTDVAVLKGSLPGLVVHSSGVHGVEGFAGSAIQIAWLSEFAARNEPRPTVVFLHAINPYGMAHYRRWNENNVDLNRNALHQKGWEVALKRDPNVVGYQDFEPIFNPQKEPTTYAKYGGFWVDVISAIGKHGMSSMKQSMVTGQYHNPKGIFFGGQELQPSLANVWEFFEQHKESLGSGTVTWINVHTGLGKSGVDTLLTFDSPTMTASELARTYPGATIPSIDKEGDEVHGGYDMSIGNVEDFVVQLFPNEQKPWIVLQEFGTVHNVLVAHALVLENMAYHFLPSEEVAKWAKLTRSAFYVRTPQWRKSILDRGLRLLVQSIARSSQ